MEATQGEEGGPNKKTRASRKKVVVPSKTASQNREKLNLEPIHAELNQEQGVVNQALVVEEQPNAPLGESEGVESEKDLDREPAARDSKIDQNQMLFEIIQSRKSTSSDATKPTYMKNVPKPTT